MIKLEERFNYIRLFFTYLEIGPKVFLKVLEYLYEGEKPLEKHLYQEILKRNHRNLTKDDTIRLRQIEDGESTLQDLDFTLLKKLIHVVCQVRGTDSVLWSGRCPFEKQNTLEYLMFHFSKSRNEVIHEIERLKFLSDAEYKIIHERNVHDLSSIINRVAIRGHLPEAKVDEWHEELLSDMHSLMTISNYSSILGDMSPPDRTNNKAIPSAKSTKPEDSQSVISDTTDTGPF